MRTFVQDAVSVGVVVVVCLAGIAQAEGFRLLSESDQPATSANNPPTTPEQALCSSCDQESCCEPSCGRFHCGGCGCGVGGCDDCPPVGIIGLVGFDSFKGISDGALQSNYGVVTGVNAAMPVPGLRDAGIGWQIGTTYGVYDFDGRTLDQHAVSTQQQVFLTTGFYRKGAAGQRLSFGAVYDWMFNYNWGSLAGPPTLGQWRTQIEYALGSRNAVGVYGCISDLYSRRLDEEILPVTTWAVSQVNVFWHHKFASGADSWLWIGMPEQTRKFRSEYFVGARDPSVGQTLSDATRIGDWIFGANIQVPLSRGVALYGNAQYMHPADDAGIDGSIEAAWNIGAGVAWYVGGHAVSHSLNGKCWTPYLPVANNSTFLVDQNAPAFVTEK